MKRIFVTKQDIKVDTIELILVAELVPSLHTKVNCFLVYFQIEQRAECHDFAAEFVLFGQVAKQKKLFLYALGLSFLSHFSVLIFFTFVECTDARL